MKVFIAIAVFMGDGIYNLLKTIYLSVEVCNLSGHDPFPKKKIRTLHLLHLQHVVLCHTSAVQLYLCTTRTYTDIYIYIHQ